MACEGQRRLVQMLLILSLHSNKLQLSGLTTGWTISRLCRFAHIIMQHFFSFFLYSLYFISCRHLEPSILKPDLGQLYEVDFSLRVSLWIWHTWIRDCAALSVRKWKVNVLHIHCISNGTHFNKSSITEHWEKGNNYLVMCSWSHQCGHKDIKL